MNILEQLKTGMDFQLKGQLVKAEAIYNEVLEKDPENPDGKHLLGLIRAEQDLYDESLALINAAIEKSPKAAPFHHNIAGILRRLGRMEEAEMRFREAIRLKPDYGEAYQGLAEIITFEENDPLLDQIHVQLDSPNSSDSVKSYLHFAAGKIYDDIGQYDKAFLHYQQGNKGASREFDSAAHRQRIKDTIYVFSKEYVRRRRGSGNPSTLPVFVVGMPRSGTSLVEQILASHSGVVGAGELNDMKAAVRSAERLVNKPNITYPNCIPGVSNNGTKRLAAKYLQTLKRFVTNDEIRVIDKHPLNFQFIGLIFDMFPNAKVIHTGRDALDTCLSCFFQNFTKGQNYTFDLIKLAHFHNDYKRLMEHWQVLYADKILTIEYESLISDQESETRRMVEFCDLDWEESCLQFHENDRVVKTASFLQVRKPIYKTSQGRSRNYTRHLEKVASVLGFVRRRPVTISSSESLTKPKLG